MLHVFAGTLAHLVWRLDLLGRWGNRMHPRESDAEHCLLYDVSNQSILYGSILHRFHDYCLSKCSSARRSECTILELPHQRVTSTKVKTYPEDHDTLHVWILPVLGGTKFHHSLCRTRDTLHDHVVCFVTLSRILQHVDLSLTKVYEIYQGT